MIFFRDLKTDNILLDEKDNIKIADFGLAFKYKPRKLFRPVSFTAVYAPPEIFLGEGYCYGDQFDMWTLGGILYELVSGVLRRNIKGLKIAELIANRKLR